MSATQTVERAEPRQGRSALGAFVDVVIVSAVLLGVAIVSAVFFTVAAGLVEAEQVLADASLREIFLSPAISPERWVRLASAGGSLVVGLGSVALLFRRLTPSGRSTGPAPHVLTADDKGLVVVSSEGIASVAEAAIMRSGGVLDADVRVRGRGASPVRILVHATVYPGSELERIGRKAREVSREAVERLVGIEVAEVVVKLEVVPPEELGRELE